MINNYYKLDLSPVITEPIVSNDSGHGMLLNTFDGQLMLVLHQPFMMPLVRAKLYEMEDIRNNIRVVHHRYDLHSKTQEATL